MEVPSIFQPNQQQRQRRKEKSSLRKKKKKTRTIILTDGVNKNNLEKGRITQRPELK